jgi:ATP-dependent exoDNAse (exonuclease V) beta subunit
MPEDDINDVLRRLETAAAEQLYSSAPTAAPPATRRYDFTALKDATTCPRQYVLKHAVGLPDELGAVTATVADTSGEPLADTTPKPARVGSLFHIVVEHCWPTGASPTAWKDHASRVAAAKGWTDCVPTVEDLIDAFFESPVSDWTIDASRVEVPFEFTLKNHTITGLIDSIPVAPDGESVIIDYKTGLREPAPEQLLVYLLATHRDTQLGLEPQPTEAAFLRVGDDGFVLDPLDIDDLDATLDRAEAAVDEWVRTAEAASYDDPEPGGWCRSCAYRHVCDAAETE